MKTGYIVQQKRTPHGPEPAVIHLADCTMIEGTPHRIRPEEARAALTDPTIEPCQFCRPDTELGMTSEWLAACQVAAVDAGHRPAPMEETAQGIAPSTDRAATLLLGRSLNHVGCCAGCQGSSTPSSDAGRKVTSR
jgi:hypothetical protein